jgi:molybdenum cofactor cytidylyltransferase
VSADDPIRAVGSIVLAAGAGRGAGVLRCMHLEDGEPWIRRAARAALDAGLWPVVAVVGDHADEVRAALAGLPVATVANPEPVRGPGGSIRLGLRRVTECAPTARGVVLVGCGPPPIDAALLRALPAAAGERPGGLAAVRYADRLGLPAFLPAALFPELAALADDQGYAEVLLHHAPEVVAVAAAAS